MPTTATPAPPVPRWGPYNELHEVIDTHHRLQGPADRDHWFDRDAAEFFGTIYPLGDGPESVWFGRFFPTHDTDRNGTGLTGYTLRVAHDDGRVSTIGELCEHTSKLDVHNAARAAFRSGAWS